MKRHEPDRSEGSEEILRRAGGAEGHRPDCGAGRAHRHHRWQRLRKERVSALAVHAGKARRGAGARREGHHRCAGRQLDEIHRSMKWKRKRISY